MREGWHVVEPGTDLVWNWHVDVICQHLEALIPVARRKPFVARDEALHFIRWLIINIPPGHMKSLLMSVFFPAWVWTFWPEFRGIFGSYAMQLAVRDSVRCRDLILSDWYQEWFTPHWRLKEDQNLKSYFANTRGGLRQCVSVGSLATGFRGDGVFIDDPLNAKEAYSEAARAEAIYWVDKVMSSRLNDPRTGVRGLIMQRLHEEDPTGHLLAKGGWEHLCLPSEFDSSRACETSIGFRDPRTIDGELLFPEFFTADVLKQAKKDLGDTDYAGQHGQQPHPDDGTILKRRHFRFWVHRGQKLPAPKWRGDDGQWHEHEVIEIPESFDALLQSWDMAFKDTKDSDLVCGGEWGRKGSNAFLLDLVWEKLSFSKSRDAVATMKADWPETGAIYIEDKANGPAIIDALRERIPGVIAVTPQGGKIARAWGAQPYQEAGNIILPHPLNMKIIERAIAECVAFPNGKNDDFVDQMTQMASKVLANPEQEWDLY